MTLCYAVVVSLLWCSYCHLKVNRWYYQECWCLQAKVTSNGVDQSYHLDERSFRGHKLFKISGWKGLIFKKIHAIYSKDCIVRDKSLALDLPYHIWFLWLSLWVRILWSYLRDFWIPSLAWNVSSLSSVLIAPECEMPLNCAKAENSTVRRKISEV
jgi:hypothetical protein